MYIRNYILLTAALLLSLFLFGCGGSEERDLIPPNFTFDGGVPSTTANPGPHPFSGTSDPGTAIVANVYFPTIDPVPTITTPVVLANGDWSFEVSDLVEGANTIAIEASDSSANTHVFYVTMVLDQTGPVVTLNQYTTPTPISTQVLAGAVAELDAQDVEVSIDSGTNWVSVDDINGGIWTYAVNLASAPGVPYDIWVRGVDKLGNKVEPGDPDEDTLIVKKQIEVDAGVEVITIVEDDAGPVYLPDPANDATLTLNGSRTADYSVSLVNITPVSSLTVDDITDNVAWTADFNALPSGNTEVTFGLNDLSVPDPIEVAQAKVLLVRDLSGPVVIDTVPAHGALNVNTASDLTLTFSETMNDLTVIAEMIEMVDDFGTTVAVTANPTVDPLKRVFTFTPVGGLTSGSTYTVTIANPALGNVTDQYGNTLIPPTVLWKFEAL